MITLVLDGVILRGIVFDLLHNTDRICDPFVPSVVGNKNKLQLINVTFFRFVIG